MFFSEILWITYPRTFIASDGSYSDSCVDKVNDYHKNIETTHSVHQRIADSGIHVKMSRARRQEQGRGGVGVLQSGPPTQLESLITRGLCRKVPPGAPQPTRFSDTAHQVHGAGVDYMNAWKINYLYKIGMNNDTVTFTALAFSM